MVYPSIGEVMVICATFSIFLLVVDGVSFKSNIQAIVAGFTVIGAAAEMALWLIWGLLVLTGKEKLRS